MWKTEKNWDNMGDGCWKIGKKWIKLRKHMTCNWSPASRHGIGRYPGSLLSTQPSVGVSSATKDSLSPAFMKQDVQCTNTKCLAFLMP